MKYRTISGIKYRLYSTGDIWCGESMKGSISDRFVLDYLMDQRWQTPASKRKLDNYIEKGEEYIKNEAMKINRTNLRKVVEKVTGEPIEDKTPTFEIVCLEHRWHLIDKDEKWYLFACNKCLRLKQINKDTQHL